jgi:energy-coupling factor transporter ATP-binding protein EcfA2
MGVEGDREAVLITGPYGSGKSSVAAEIADVLEKRREPYAYLDLDFLAWGYPGSDEEGAEHRMMLKNLAPVLANYLAAGVRVFVLAGSIRDRSELDGLEAVLRMPLRVVRLVVSLGEIEARLATDVTSGRRDDLRRAATQIAASEGVGLEGLTLPNKGPVRQAAFQILEWLGWR